MSWVAWAMIGFMILNLLCYVALVGRPRQPIKGYEAALSVVITSAYIIGIVYLGGGFG